MRPQQPCPTTSGIRECASPIQRRRYDVPQVHPCERDERTNQRQGQHRTDCLSSIRHVVAASARHSPRTNYMSGCRRKQCPRVGQTKNRRTANGWPQGIAQTSTPFTQCLRPGSIASTACIVNPGQTDRPNMTTNRHAAVTAQFPSAHLPDRKRHARAGPSNM